VPDLVEQAAAAPPEGAALLPEIAAAPPPETPAAPPPSAALPPETTAAPIPAAPVPAEPAEHEISIPAPPGLSATPDASAPPAMARARRPNQRLRSFVRRSEAAPDAAPPGQATKFAGFRPRRVAAPEPVSPLRTVRETIQPRPRARRWPHRLAAVALGAAIAAAILTVRPQLVDPAAMEGLRLAARVVVAKAQDAAQAAAAVVRRKIDEWR
jgi:hypothetical protein